MSYNDTKDNDVLNIDTSANKGKYSERCIKETNSLCKLRKSIHQYSIKRNAIEGAIKSF